MPSWKKVIISGSDAHLNSLNTTSALTASGNIYPTTSGSSGQVITTDGLGNLSFEYVQDVYVPIKNVSGGELVKGTPVHATSSVSAGNTTPVIAASASDATTMPATFVLNETLANEEEGIALLSGYIQGIDTSLFTVGEVVYVGENGGFTNVKPTGSGNLVQNLGVVTKVHASNGSGWVYGSGRSNDVPNLPTGKIWVGSDAYSVTSSIIHFNESTSQVEFTGSISLTGSFTGSTAQLNALPTASIDEDTVVIVDTEGNLKKKTLSNTSGTSGLAFYFEQTSPSSTWTINHTLSSSLLNITVTDANKNVIIPDNIDLSDNNSTVVTFTTPTAGYAILSTLSGNPAGTSGTSGLDGTFFGTSGTSGVDSTSGTSGISGTSGTSGETGTSGTAGSSGTSGIDGIDGSDGTSGISGANGIDGTSGTSGASGTAGTSGISGTSGLSKGGGYIYTQTTPATTWNITHNLDTRPLNVDVYDTNYNLMITEDVSYPTVDTAVIGFDTAQAGYAIFSSISASVYTSVDYPNLQQVLDVGNSGSQNMYITGSSYVTGSFEVTGSIALKGSMVATGNVTANNFVTTSDRELKSEITAISGGIDTIKQITAYTYNKNGEPDAGFIAQEVQQVLPYAVHSGNNGYLTMNDRPILAHLHQAVVELEERIKAIETKLG